MPRGYVGALAPDEARAFADALAGKTREAGIAAGGWIEHSVCVGEVPVTLAFTDPPIAEVSVDPFAKQGTARWPPVRIFVWSTEASGVLPPPPAWDWHASRYQSDDVIVTYERERRRLTVVDLSARTACCWVASPSTWPVWERAAPFRDLLDRLLSTTGHAFLHAGTLGNDAAAILLAGPSGSGKSTTTAAGVAAGFTTLGDDYVILDPDGSHLHALYDVIRLVPSSPAVGEVRDATLDHQGKLMVPLGRASASPVRSRLRAAAIALPTVTGREATTIEPAGAARALKALAPTSLVQLDPRAGSLRAMRTLVERLPRYDVALGSDLPQMLIAVRRLLEAHE